MNAMTHHHDTQPTTIAVVGFPKSGNTWLVRLLADALNAPVHERLIDNHVEFASEVNQHLREPANTAIRVAKLHDLPETLVQRRLPGSFKFVYVHRDPRDVAVSAFFHFTKWDDATIRPLFERGPRNLVQSWRRRRARRAIRGFIDRFTRRGIPKLERKMGRWDQHVQAWQAADLPVVHVGYEQLLASTPMTLARLIKALGVSSPSLDISGAVERQSFKNTRKQFEAADERAIPLGKQFGLRFMRRGVIGDWRVFLDHDQVDRIRARFAETFNQLGYNRGWHEAAVADAMEAAA